MKFIKSYRKLLIDHAKKQWIFYDNFPLINSDEFYYLVYKRLRTDSDYAKLDFDFIDVHRKDLKLLIRLLLYFNKNSTLEPSKNIHIHYPARDFSSFSQEGAYFYNDRTIIINKFKTEVLWNFGQNFMEVLNEAFLKLQLFSSFRFNPYIIDSSVNDELDFLRDNPKENLKPNFLNKRIVSHFEAYQNCNSKHGIYDFIPKNVLTILEIALLDKAYPLKMKKKHPIRHATFDLRLYVGHCIYEFICGYIQRLHEVYKIQNSFFEPPVEKFSINLNDLIGAGEIKAFQKNYYEQFSAISLSTILKNYSNTSEKILYFT